MNIERYLRMIAGAFVMASVALGYWVHPAWFLFTGFVGLNQFQSAFTNWCPMMTFLKKAGVPAAMTVTKSCGYGAVQRGSGTTP
jgi:hypothetical protein